MIQAFAKPGAVFTAVIFLLIFCWVQEVRAESGVKSIMATGAAGIQGENMAKARQDALQDALRQALEQGVGVYMDARSIVANSKLVEKIVTNVQGYVAAYEILQERESGGLFRVTVQAEVRTGDIRDELMSMGLLKAMMDYPRVLLLPAPEQPITAQSRTAETILIREFTDRRFELVDPDQSAKLHSEAKALLEITSPIDVAARIGLDHHAEVVIMYKTEAGRSRHDGLMETAPASLRTRVVLSTTAQILTAQDHGAHGLGNTPDLAVHDGTRKAAVQSAETVSAAVTTWWWDYTANGTPHTVILRAKPGQDRLVMDFQQAVESIPNVTALSERASGGGVTEMTVRYRGSAGDLRRAMFDALQGRPGFQGLKTEVSKGRYMVLSLL